MAAVLFARAEGIRGGGHPGNSSRSSVPRHTEVNDLLAKKICKDLGIPRPTHT